MASGPTTGTVTGAPAVLTGRLGLRPGHPCGDRLLTSVNGSTADTYKAERNARLDANYRAEPVPLASVMTSSPLPLARQWTRVTARGEYTTRHPIYVRNRPNLGSTGFELVSPFRLDTGQVVLVDRGWVEASSSGADVLPAAPAPPTETVTLVGWALPGEASKGRKLPAGQLASINLPEAARATGEDLLGGYVRLQEERSASGDVAPAPTPLDPPDRSLGPHQAYAYQWWLTMPLGVVLIWFGIRRDLRMEAEDGPTGRRRARQAQEGPRLGRGGRLSPRPHVPDSTAWLGPTVVRVG